MHYYLLHGKTRRFETIEISYANKSVRFGFRNLHAVEARS